jgi:hypothetical protein
VQGGFEIGEGTMFAHQVIEDIQEQVKMLDKRTIKKTYEKYYHFLSGGAISLLKKSVKFHIENERDVLLLRREAFDKKVVFMYLSEYMKLPYDTIYIDYFCDDHKANPEVRASKIAAILSKVNEKEMMLYLFCCHYATKKWIASPVIYQIRIGENFENTTGNVMQFCLLPTDNKMLKTMAEEDRGEFTILSSFLLLLNCKNIAPIIISPSRKINSCRRRKGKQELFTYKTLQIKLPGTKQDRGESQPTGDHNRIHFCRGHFKEYTEDQPLFGKITGLWWWQPHVRGQNRDGIVLKDYQIKTTRQPEARA